MRTPPETSEPTNTRREFLSRAAALGISAALPPFVASGQPVPPTRLRTDRRLLTPNDLTYLGVVRLPLDQNAYNANGGIRFGYATGQMITGRYVNGTLHLFLGMSQANSYLAPVIELVYDRSPHLTIGSAGRLSVYKVWGQIQQPTVRDPNGARMHALHWDEDLQALFYTFDAFYSTEWNRTIGAVTFSGTTSYTRHGPWRTTSPKRQTNGPILEIPADTRASFGGHTKLSVGVANSINAVNTWGHSLYSWDSRNILSSPPDDYTDESRRSLVTTPRMRADISNKMQRAATYKDCVYTDADYNCTGGVALSGPRSVCSQMDIALGAAWVRTASKQGIVFVDQMVDRVSDSAFRSANYSGDDLPHVFYSTYKNCCHGQSKGLNEGTGPHSPSLVPQLWIYDEQTLLSGASGAITPYQAANTPSTSHKHLYDYSSNFTFDSSYYNLGLYFDPISRLMFVPDAGRDPSQFEPLPVVHVFRVAD